MATSNRFRTEHKAYGFLTSDEEHAIQDHIQLWIDRAFRTDPIEPERIIPAIKQLYKAAGFTRSPSVVVAPSPLAAAYIYGAAAAHCHRRDYPRGSDQLGTYAARKSSASADTRLKDVMHSPAKKQTADATATLQFDPWPQDQAKPDYRRGSRYLSESMSDYASKVIQRGLGEVVVTGMHISVNPGPPVLRNRRDKATEIEHRLSEPMRGAIRATFDGTDHEVRAPFQDKIHSMLSPAKHPDAVSDYLLAITTEGARERPPLALLENAYAVACWEHGGELGLDCAREWAFACQGGNAWGAYECFISAMRDIIGLRLPAHRNFAIWEQAAIEGSYRLCHEQFCVVSDFPEIIKTDPEGRAHCETGPSHRWRDGWALYNWHGVAIPEAWIERKHELSARDALTWGNIEQRRAACEILGWDKILDQLNAKVIDDDGDPEIGTLLEVDLPGFPGFEAKIKARFVRVQCGTGRTFAICVPPVVQTAIEAQAWMINQTVDQFMKPEVRT